VTLKDTWQSQQDSAIGRPTSGSNSAITAPISTANAEIEDVRRIDIRVGKILSAAAHPDADSLYVEQIDCGDAEGPRTVVSGLAKHMALSDLPGKLVLVVCNLKPAKMRGILSEGMVLAASKPVGDGGEEIVELVLAPAGARVGERISVEGYAAAVPDPQLKSKSAQEAWKRVASALKVNGDKVAVYGDKDAKLTTSAGVCSVASLVDAVVR
jgi:methionine--tRNA ligase beta chain